MALLLGILFTIIVSGIVISGAMLLRAYRTQTDTNFRMRSQAVQFARAGLIEGMAWFRKSPTQPVSTFWPVNNTVAVPPVIETMDPDVGIVREFQISGSIWGRYEVWKQWNADPVPARLAWRQKFEVLDVSSYSGAAGVGSVWQLTSMGYVYQRTDPTVPYNQQPNRILGSDALSTEVRRLTLAPPGQAAICVRYGGTTTVKDKSNVQGTASGAGIFYKAGTGSVTVTGGATIAGTPGLSGSSSYDDSLTAVFGVDQNVLKVLADDRITDETVFPSPVAANALYHVEVPTLNLTAARPLNGSAIVYVKGNVDFKTGNKSFFTGMLFVDGNLTIREPVEFNGTIVCTGTLFIEGTSDWINITYDDAALNTLRQAVGQYRLSSAIRRTLSSE